MERTAVWEHEEQIDLDALVDAIEATARALKLDVTVVREGTGGGDEDEDAGEARHEGRIVITSLDAFDDIRVDVRTPVELQGMLRFHGHQLELDPADVEGPWEPLYLFWAHVATALGALPEAPYDYGDESPFLDEVRSWIDAAFDDHLTEASMEPGTIPIAIEASPGAVGPFHLDGRRDTSGLVLDVRGAGTDLRVTVGGRILEMSDRQLEPLFEVLRGGGLAEEVARERAAVLGKSAPAANAAYGGEVVLHVWVDGVCTRSEILDPSQSIRDTLERAAREGTCDVVRYLSNGTPLRRAVRAELRDQQSVADFERTATWRWVPASTEEVARAFHEAARRLPAPLVAKRPTPEVTKPAPEVTKAAPEVTKPAPEADGAPAGTPPPDGLRQRAGALWARLTRRG